MKLPRPLILTLALLSALVLPAVATDRGAFTLALQGGSGSGWLTGLGDEFEGRWVNSLRAELILAWHQGAHPQAMPSRPGVVSFAWYEIQPGEEGFHALTETFVRRAAAIPGRIELRVWVVRAGQAPQQGETPLVRTTLEAGELFDFDAFLGYLAAGDRVYVGVGTAGDPAGDETDIDFRLERTPFIPVSQIPVARANPAQNVGWNATATDDPASPAARQLAWGRAIPASGSNLALFRVPHSGYYAFHQAWVNGAAEVRVFVGAETTPRRTIRGDAGKRTSLDTDFGYVAKGELISLAFSTPAQFAGFVIEWAPRRAPLRVIRGGDGYLDLIEPAAPLQAVDVPAARWITVPATNADATEAIRSAFAAAAKSAAAGGYAGIRLEAGKTYRVASQQPKGRVFDLRGIERVAFDGNGATLHIGSAEQAREELQLFHLTNCRNLAFADFIATGAEIPFTTGQILDVTPRGPTEMTQTVTFRVDPGELDPLKDIARNGRSNAYAYDPAIPGRLGVGTWTHYPASGTPSIKATDKPGVFTHTVTRTNNSIEPGMKWLIKNKNAGVIYLETRGTTENVTLSNIDGRASGGGQLRFWQTSGINILNCRFEPDGDNWISSSADGVHGRGREGVWIEDTLIRGVCEDIMNTYGQNMVVEADKDAADNVMSIRMFERSSGSTSGRALRMPTPENVTAGDHLVFFNPKTGRVLGYAGVVGIKDGRFTLTNSIPDVDSWEEADGKNATMVYNTRVAGRFFVRDSRLMDSMRIGIYIKARGGVIFGTQFEGLSAPGVLAMNEPEWPEGPPPTHLWVQGCTFSQNNYGFMPRNRDYIVADPADISVYTRHFRDPAVPDDYRAFVTRGQHANSNVKLLGNVFRDWRGMGIAVRNSRNVRIEDNLFLAPVDDPVMRATLATDPALAVDGKGAYAAIYLDSASGVNLAGNRFAGLPATDRQVVQDTDVSGVVGTDNLARPALAGPTIALSFNEWFGATSAEAAGAGRVADTVQLSGATHRAGRFGPGLHFTGKDRAVIADSDDGKASTFTIALWARPSLPKEGMQVVLNRGSGRTGLLIGIAAGRWFAEGWDAAPAPRLDLGAAIDGQWQHLAISYDDAGGTLRAYVDGMEVASASHLKKPAAGEFSLGGGESKAGAASAFQGFQGELDEFCFFPQVLAPEDLAALALRRW